ncbi:MAG: pseudouridine synthase [Hyphomicrobiales bacterium]|nr:MAG: pseudouridine synthase [Hyphomicrobiales bacterium]
MTKEPETKNTGERIAKVMARAGLCSRREAEQWIAAGRVSLNGKVLASPAVTVSESDTVLVDGRPLPKRERTRLWAFHKPRGLVTTTHDPEGRPTVFDKLPADLPRVMTVGRLDINTEGLLLLTNDGGLARVLELPTTGWLRRYRVRAHGTITQEALDKLADGFAVDGILYGAIEAKLDRTQGQNVWLTLGLREGKNREVKRVLEALGLSVNRLIRMSYGPFQLGDLPAGEVHEIRGRVLRDQLGKKLTDEAGADFDTPTLPRVPAPKAPEEKPRAPRGKPKPVGGHSRRQGDRFDDDERDARPARGGRGGANPRGAAPEGKRGDRSGGRPGDKPEGDTSRGPQQRGKGPGRDADRPAGKFSGKPGGKPPRGPARGERADRGPGGERQSHPRGRKPGPKKRP